jgi:hypothetical protein
LIQSCELSLHDNYIEIEKPDEATIPFEIYLDVESDGKTIYFYSFDYYTSHIVNFNFKTNGRSILKCTFTMGNRTWEFYEASGSFAVYKGEFPDTKYTLTCELIFESATGSIAEQLGMEQYRGTMSWPVECVLYQQPEPSLTGKVNSDGFLELSWEKPVLPESMFKYYLVEHLNGFDKDTISDMNQLTSVSKSYFGNYDSYYVYAVLSDSYRWNLGDLSLSRVNVNVNVNYSDEDSILISWDNPYKATVNISHGNVTVAKDVKDNHVKIAYGKFGSPVTDYYIDFSPYEKTETSEWLTNSFSIYKDIKVSPGKMLGDNYYYFNKDQSGYNPYENILYIHSGSDLKSYILPEITEYKSRRLDDNTYQISVSSQSNSGRIAVNRGRIIEILDGKDLNTVNTIRAEAGRSFLFPFAFTNDNKILCMDDYSTNSILKVYDLQNEYFEKEIKLSDFFSYQDQLYVAPNGEYVYFEQPYPLRTIYMYQLNDYTIVNKNKYTHEYSGWGVSPLKPDRLYVSDNGNIDEYESMSLEKTGKWNFSGMKVGNIDPKTGYLLLYGYDKIIIIDPESKNVIYERDVAGSWFALYGNVLISENGHALNVEKYLNK